MNEKGTLYNFALKRDTEHCTRLILLLQYDNKKLQFSCEDLRKYLGGATNRASWYNSDHSVFLSSDCINNNYF